MTAQVWAKPAETFRKASPPPTAIGKPTLERVVTAPSWPSLLLPQQYARESVVIPQVWRRVAIGATIALVVLIGLSRLSLGVHYVSDVLGGYALGAAWLSASVAAFEIWREERGKLPTHPFDEGVEPEELDGPTAGGRGSSRP